MTTKTFDERMREAYLNENPGVRHRLCSILTSYPQQYRELLALRGSVIKWELVCAGELSEYKACHEVCAMCAHMGLGVCEGCVAQRICKRRYEISNEEIHSALFEMYMTEHRKVEAENGI